MTELQQYMQSMLRNDIQKIIISNPLSKSEEYKKIIVENKGKNYQIAKYTEKQVFHENVTFEELEDKCIAFAEGRYKQINGISATEEHIILISKKGKCNYKVKKIATDAVKLSAKTVCQKKQCRLIGIWKQSIMQ